MSKLRIGVSMRRQDVLEYAETRDALDRRWSAFLHWAFSETPWLPMPNMGNGITRFIEQWKLSGFILTGGDSLGKDPERDRTEFAIVEYALANSLPVLGVCRGMEILCHHFGGQLQRTSGHCATSHELTVVSDWSGQRGKIIRTNSFHEWGISADGCPDELEPLAVSACGGMEAVVGREHRLLGFMWHPERDGGAPDFSRACMRKLFGE